MSHWRGMGMGAAAMAAAVLAGTLGVNAADEGPGRGVEKKRRFELMRGPGAGHLGVTLEDGEEPGAVVKDVRPDTPAASAGLQAGDVIVRYQGDRVEGAAALARMVRETPAGRQVQMDVSRNGSVQRLSATLEKGHGLQRLAEGLGPEALEDFDFDIELPDIPPLPGVPAVPPIPPAVRDFERSEGFRRLLRETGGARKLGIEYQEISGQLARYFKLGEERGILVSQVDEDGPAAKAGLKAGDVILKFNGNAVTDSRILRDQVRKAEPGSEATLTVSREGRTLDLTVKLGGTAPARRPGRTT
jgi:serine protease Do